MDAKNVADLISIKKQIVELEGKIESILRKMARKQEINFERPDDYGKRGFTLQIYFDELNIQVFEKAEEIISLWRVWSFLRKQQRKLEIEYNANKTIENSVKDGIQNPMINQGNSL